MKNLLVAVDMKPSDTKLLHQATVLAEKFGSKVWVIHVAAPEPDFVGYDIGPKYLRDVLAEELRAEHQMLQSYIDDLRSSSIEVDALLIQGPTVELIQSEVEKLNIDMLILGSHQHHFLYETFVGHTAAKMIGSISIPLLIVPLDHETRA